MGALTATGTPNLLALAASVTAGGMAGDRLTYLIGRKAGGRLRNRRLLSAKGRAEQALLRYGGAAFAGSPLLGAAFGMGVGLLLGGTHLVVEKLRAHRRRRPATAATVRARGRAARPAAGYPLTDRGWLVSSR